jgi:hypothetical protein
MSGDERGGDTTCPYGVVALTSGHVCGGKRSSSNSTPATWNAYRIGSARPPNAKY